VSSRALYENGIEASAVSGTQGFSVGVMGGFAIKFSEHFQLMPYAGLTKGLFAWYSVPPVYPTPVHQRDVLIHIGLGFLGQ